MVVHDIRNLAAAKAAEHYAVDARDQISFHDFWSFIKRRAMLLLLSSALGVAAGAAYLANTPANYTAVARLVMDPSQAKIASQDAASGTIIIEAAEIASQVEIVKSEAVARSVIAELDLTNDPEIQNVSSIVGTVKSWISTLTTKASGTPQLLTDDQRMRRTMAGFLARVSARRVGLSYVLEVGYSSADPDRAALIANAIARTYIRNGMTGRSEAAKRGSEWLEERLIEIAKQARQSQMAVEEYRAAKGITQVGDRSTLDQRQLVEISSQLLQAQAATTTDKAKLDTIAKLVNGTEPEAGMDETLNSPLVIKLRDEMRLAENRLEGLKLRYEPANPAIISAQAEISRLKGELQSEYLRLENVLRSNLEVTMAKERLMNSQMGIVRDRDVQSNLAQVDLAELESRASTYRKMYESVLQQLLSALQVQSFPLGTARITTAASSPFSKSSPKPALVLPLSLLLGLGSGLMGGALRETMNRSIRTSTRLQRETGVATLASIPVYSPKRSLFGGLGNAAWTRGSLRKLRVIIDDPYSAFSETLRDLKTSIDAGNPKGAPIVIGITSAFSGEGKTMIAANLAQLYRNESVPAVLVDADFESPALSMVLNSHGNEVELISEHETSEQKAAPANESRTAARSKSGRARAIAEAPDDFELELMRDLHGSPLPVVRAADLKIEAGKGATFRYLPALRTRLDDLRERYRVVIVDMSGFASSADARAVCAMMDGVVIVIGDPQKMTVDFFAKSLRRFGPARINLLGVVLNRTSPDFPRQRRAKARVS
jgi:polysaccharide biosynthesis transport protein